MKYLYSLLLIFCAFTISSYTNIEINPSNKITDSTDSIIIARIINETSRLRDTIQLYEQYDYDFKNTNDTINILKDSIEKNNAKLSAEYNKSYQNIQKSVLLDNDKSKQVFIKEFNDLRILQNKIEKEIDEMNLTLKKLNASQIMLKANRDKLEKLIQLPKKNIANLISSVKSPIILPIEFWNSKFRVVIVNNQYNDFKIIPNSTGTRKVLNSYYGNTISKSNYGVLMNAGMFEANGAAVGLLISNRKIVNEINIKKGLSGNFYDLSNAIFYTDTLGRYFIEGTNIFNEKFKNGKYPHIAFATQSAPLLINEGKINPELGFRSKNAVSRNGIGIVNNSKNNSSIFIISETKTTFYELAALFKFLGCDDALYLDGTVSQLIYKGPKKEMLFKTSATETQPLGPVFAVTSRDNQKDTTNKKNNK